MKLPKIDEKFLPPQLFAKLFDSNIVFYISQQHFGITSSFFVVIPPSLFRMLERNVVFNVTFLTIKFPVCPERRQM